MMKLLQALCVIVRQMARSLRRWSGTGLAAMRTHSDTWTPSWRVRGESTIEAISRQA
jgi:hypothetical protein